MSKGSFSLGDSNESAYTSSSQAAYKKPSTDNLQNPASKRNSQTNSRSTFSLGPENQDGESNFISSNTASYGSGQPKPSARRDSQNVQNVSNFVTTNSYSYGSPTKKPNKDKENVQTSSPTVYVGRHATSAARYASADNVLASYGSSNQTQGQGQGATPASNSSTFITSNAAAYKNPSGSSSSSSRSGSNSSSDNGSSSNFQSSNSSYGRGAAPTTDVPAAGGSFGRGPQAARSESGSFQIGFSTDSNFATSNSVAFSKPSENKERLQDHNKHSARSSPIDSDNPLGPSNLNQGVLPSSSSTSSLSSVSSNNSKNSNNQNYDSNTNSNQNNQVGRGISERHKGLQRSSFNPITGE